MGLIKAVMFELEDQRCFVRAKEFKLPHQEVWDNFMGLGWSNVIIDIDDMLEDIEKFKKVLYNIKRSTEHGDKDYGWTFGEGEMFIDVPRNEFKYKGKRGVLKEGYDTLKIEI